MSYITKFNCFGNCIEIIIFQAKKLCLISFWMEVEKEDMIEALQPLDEEVLVQA
jgi:hypothetical protein